MKCLSFVVAFWLPLSSVYAQVETRLQTFDCLFNFAEANSDGIVLSNSVKTGIESEYYYRYFDITDSYLAISDIDNNVYLYQPQVSSEITLLGDADYWLNVAGCNKLPAPVLPTSYENEHRSEVKPFELPDKLTEIYGNYDWTSTVALADFTRNGELELITATHHAAFRDGFYADGTPFYYGDLGKIQFWRRDHSGSKWIEITQQFLPDNNNDGCILPRKALISDFNVDGKPDVLFNCTGHTNNDLLDRTQSNYSLTDEDAPAYVYEKPLILLSQPDGSYKKEAAVDYAAYAHGAAAGDLNEDGFIDVVITDEKKWDQEECASCSGGIKYTQTRGKSIWFLWGKGDGTFELSDGKLILPEHVYNEAYKYWAVEILDFDNDGHLDIWLGGSAKDWILYNDGDSNFYQRFSEMPKTESYYDSLDLVKNGNNIYVYSINEDYSKPHYYWGDALSKIDLVSLEFELVYEHEGYYRTVGPCSGVSCSPWLGDDYLLNWFPWIVVDDGYVRPLDKAYEINLYKTD